MRSQIILYNWYQLKYNFDYRHEYYPQTQAAIVKEPNEIQLDKTKLEKAKQQLKSGKAIAGGLYTFVDKQ